MAVDSTRPLESRCHSLKRKTGGATSASHRERRWCPPRRGRRADGSPENIPSKLQQPISATQLYDLRLLGQVVRGLDRWGSSWGLRVNLAGNARLTRSAWKTLSEERTDSSKSVPVLYSAGHTPHLVDALKQGIPSPRQFPTIARSGWYSGVLDNSYRSDKSWRQRHWSR